MERLLTVDEVSDVTRENIVTTYRRIRCGEIPSLRIGKRSLRVREKDLFEWLKIRNGSEAGEEGQNSYEGRRK